MIFFMYYNFLLLLLFSFAIFNQFIFIRTVNSAKCLLNRPMKRNFFVSTIPGMEQILIKEVSNFADICSIKKEKSGISFVGSTKTGFEALLWIRSGLRLMELISSSNGISTSEQLYEWIRSIEWNEIISTHNSIKCDTIFGEKVPKSFNHPHFTSLTIKNAIIDQFRDIYHTRPDVNIETPDLPLLLYLHGNSAKLYRVWSGSTSMHKRGYRTPVIHKASLRETTAAGVLLSLGWKEKSENSIIIDPMCGSGTFLIEAALISANVAPGLINAKQKEKLLKCPSKWNDIEHTELDDVIDLARSLDLRANINKNREVFIFGNDQRKDSIELGKASAILAGVERMINWDCQDIRNFNPPCLSGETNELILTNPPWGSRLSKYNKEDLIREKLYPFYHKRLVKSSTRHPFLGNFSHVDMNTKGLFFDSCSDHLLQSLKNELSKPFVSTNTHNKTSLFLLLGHCLASDKRKRTKIHPIRSDYLTSTLLSFHSGDHLLHLIQPKIGFTDSSPNSKRTQKY